jgi:hypothetical protein
MSDVFFMRQITLKRCPIAADVTLKGIYGNVADSADGVRKLLCLQMTVNVHQTVLQYACDLMPLCADAVEDFC